MKVELKSITPNAELNIVEIARVSSSREDKKEEYAGLLNYLIKNKHWSPFQHSYLTFEIVTSKAIAIQFLRHLSFTFQEFSQRYAKVTALEPVEFRRQAVKNRQSSTDVIGSLNQVESQIHLNIFEEDISEEMLNWIEKVADHLENSLSLYNEGLELGVAKECARFILPMTTQTTLYMTGSVRSWIHFIQLRDDGHAQKEAQVIAREIKAIFNKELPIISEALNWKA